MASQLSGVRPNAFERRNAISGLTALLPFKTRLKVELATPSLVLSSQFATANVVGLEIHRADEFTRVRGVMHCHQW